jgi:hypothetical protein
VLESGEIDLAAFENGFVLVGEILANDGHHANWREMAGGQREIAGRAAQRAVHFPWAFRWRQTPRTHNQ